ncbi:hypothetical protein CONLIGDRAFT_649820 [Coniochaeta ligniaria NRRL 30616]|uniref:Uncharacterized protein n=1 Tax=Coniochaeta ligniaria NRRL 30616 TaxID=1408157 RepID=A0A1J7J2B7_9PEZI|nr:hypothetical protein CONLIGDRAFT_649820 [Coniochaeta ligniaria NRRL 30616]
MGVNPVVIHEDVFLDELQEECNVEFDYERVLLQTVVKGRLVDFIIRSLILLEEGVAENDAIEGPTSVWFGVVKDKIRSTVPVHDTTFCVVSTYVQPQFSPAPKKKSVKMNHSTTKQLFGKRETLKCQLHYVSSEETSQQHTELVGERSPNLKPTSPKIPEHNMGS